MAPAKEDEPDNSCSFVSKLDYKLRSLTCLGEILYEEKLHPHLHAKRRENPNKKRDEGFNIVRYISRLLVRKAGEDVAFVVKLADGKVKETAVATTAGDVVDGGSDDGNDDGIGDVSGNGAHTNTKNSVEPSVSSGQPLEAMALDNWSQEGVLIYIVMWFGRIESKESRAKRRTIPFHIHVMNTINLLRNCSGTRSFDSKAAFLYYTVCMGIEKWSKRYFVGKQTKRPYLRYIAFDKFLQDTDLSSRTIASSKKNWPITTIKRHTKKQLLDFLEEFAAIFTDPRDYDQLQNELGENQAKEHWKSRERLAMEDFRMAKDAIEEERVDWQVAQFYHITLGQALKDAQDWSAMAITALTKSGTSNPKVTTDLLISYITATQDLYRGIFDGSFLLRTYQKGLKKCIEIEKGTTIIPGGDWSSNQDPSNLTPQHPAFWNEELDPVNVSNSQEVDDMDDAYDSQEDQDGFDDFDPAAFPEGSQELWLAGCIAWLQNTAKGWYAFNNLVRFADEPRNQEMLQSIVEKINIPVCRTPSGTMQD